MRIFRRFYDIIKIRKSDRIMIKMSYINAMDINQMMLCSLDDFVDEESITRLIDAFIESLEISQLNITKSEVTKECGPSYNPKSLLKLYTG